MEWTDNSQESQPGKSEFKVINLEITLEIIERIARRLNAVPCLISAIDPAFFKQPYTNPPVSKPGIYHPYLQSQTKPKKWQIRRQLLPTPFPVYPCANLPKLEIA
jgi:hypothetical protein